MKNFQKLALALFVGVMALGFSAFTSSNNLAVQQWHFKDGQPLSNANIASSYELVTSPPQDCDSEPGLPCIVQFTTSTSTPNLSAYLASFTGANPQLQIANAAFVKRSN